MCSACSGVSCCADPPPFRGRGEEMAVTRCKPVNVTLQQLLGSQGGWWYKLALQDKKAPVATAVHLIFQSDCFKAPENHFSEVQACLPQFMCAKNKPRGLNVAG